ncbi:hypothetical protein SDC9_182309 [bioreactor metagenome]|uniref:Uncharacterized protein n=1 Tax=bioreactor metagenome TaxID=1076179 RepID=A0A645H744_9ZZZZ
MTIALRGHFSAHMPQDVHIWALRRAFAALSNIVSAPSSVFDTTDISPPPKSFAVAPLVLTMAISNSSEYLTSPIVLRASATEEKSLDLGILAMASTENPPAAQEEAPFSILIVGPSAFLGTVRRSRSSASFTILGGRTFQRQKPISAYSCGSPLLAAYSRRWSFHLS